MSPFSLYTHCLRYVGENSRLFSGGKLFDLPGSVLEDLVHYLSAADLVRLQDGLAQRRIETVGVWSNHWWFLTSLNSWPYRHVGHRYQDIDSEQKYLGQFLELLFDRLLSEDSDDDVPWHACRGSLHQQFHISLQSIEDGRQWRDCRGDVTEAELYGILEQLNGNVRNASLRLRAIDIAKVISDPRLLRFVQMNVRTLSVVLVISEDVPPLLDLLRAMVCHGCLEHLDIRICCISLAKWGDILGLLSGDHVPPDVSKLDCLTEDLPQALGSRNNHISGSVTPFSLEDQFEDMDPYSVPRQPPGRCRALSSVKLDRSCMVQARVPRDPCCFNAVLVPYLRNWPELRSLVVNTNWRHAEQRPTRECKQLGVVVEALLRSHQLTELELWECNDQETEPDAAKHLSTIFRGLSHRTAPLQRLTLTSMSSAAVAKVVQDFQPPGAVALQCRSLDLPALVTLVPQLACWPHLKHLDLAGCEESTPSDFLHQCYLLLQQGPKLQTLHLGNFMLNPQHSNLEGRQYWRDFAAVLAHHPCLTKLDLTGNDMGDDGAEYLLLDLYQVALAMPQPPKLGDLDLSSTGLSGTGLLAAVKAILALWQSAAQPRAFLHTLRVVDTYLDAALLSQDDNHQWRSWFDSLRLTVYAKLPC